MRYIWIYFLIFFFYVFDLGNLDAIRQSTEGFYLQIVKEMHLSDSFLTPQYMGENHWSKPPGHFWLGLIFSKAFGQTNIFFPRFSMVLVSLLGVFFISRWLKRHFSIAPIHSFIFLGATIGVFRYAKIYMMEAPLAFFSLLGALKLYDYLESNKKSDLFYASALMAYSILIKGPVSVVMIALGLLPYYIRYKNFYIKKSLSLIGLTLCISSLWFLLSYANYGYEFFKTFFLDQNLGKFTAQKYPTRVLFQGLIIFSLPWILYLPFYSNRKYFRQFSTNPTFFFLVCQFLGFFLIWFIPNQKSHHYAYPASLILSMLLSILILKAKQHHTKELIPGRIIGFIGILIGALIFYGISVFDEFIISLPHYFSLIFLCLVSCLLFVSRNILVRLLSPFLIMGIIYNFLLPIFYLPYIPQKAVDLIGHSKIAVVARKPYFIKEQIDSPEMEVLSPSTIKPYILKNDHLYFVHEPVYKGQSLNEVTKTLHSWTIWKRGRRFHHIWNALKGKNLSSLREKVFLLKNQ
ncbi:MAG: ArnT family glycosyltransferase [Bacteriovoracaceae bacterium]